MKSIFRKLLRFCLTLSHVEVIFNPYGDSLIEKKLERKTFLSRPDRSGHADGYVKTLIEQPMTSNFDYVFIVTSLNQNFNAGRIARYIAVTIQGGGIPVVVLSKADLCDDVDKYIAEVKSVSDKTDVIAVSSVTGQGMSELQKYFKSGVTIALIGSSGVGKSTMLNAVADREVMKLYYRTRYNEKYLRCLFRRELSRQWYSTKSALVYFRHS